MFYVPYKNQVLCEYSGADPGGVMGSKDPPSGIILGKPK